MSQFVFIGKRASGKDTATSYLEEEYGVPSVRFSTVIEDVAKAEGILSPDAARTKENLQHAGNTLRDRYGEKKYTREVARRAQGRPHTLNGVRHPGELDVLREWFAEDLVLVGVVAEQGKRFRRARQSGIVESWEEFEELEENPAEQRIDTLLDRVDETIENNDSVAAFREKLAAFATRHDL